MRKIFTRNAILAFLSAILLIFFIIWSVLVNAGKLDWLDNKIVEGVIGFRGEKGGFWYWLCRITTEFGFVYIIVAVIILFLVLRKADLKSILLGLGVGMTYIINMIVKLIIRRERPAEEYRWMVEHSMSYPSSHTMCTTFFYGFITYIVLTSNLNKRVKIAISTIAIAIIPWVGFTRIVLSVHYFSDVIGGLVFGITLLFAAIPLYEHFHNKGYDGFKNKIEAKLAEKKEH